MIELDIKIIEKSVCLYQYIYRLYMNIELIIVLLLFAGALFYILRRIFASVSSRSCGTKCSACITIDAAKAKLPIKQ